MNSEFQKIQIHATSFGRGSSKEEQWEMSMEDSDEEDGGQGGGEGVYQKEVEIET